MDLQPNPDEHGTQAGKHRNRAAHTAGRLLSYDAVERSMNRIMMSIGASGTTTIFLRSEHQASPRVERGLRLALQADTDTNTEHTTTVLNSTHSETQ